MVVIEKSEYILGYMTAMIESCGQIKLLETRYADKFRIPVVIIEMQHHKPEVLDKFKRLLGLRKSTEIKKVGGPHRRMFVLKVSEHFTKELLMVITPAGMERRKQVALELIAYKEKHDIKFGQSKAISMKHQKQLDNLIERMNCIDDV